MTIEDFVSDRVRNGVIHLYDGKLKKWYFSMANLIFMHCGNVDYTHSLEALIKCKSSGMTVAYRFVGNDLSDKKSVLSAIEDDKYNEYSIELAFSFRHPKDKFCKKEGRELAVQRLIGDNPIKFVVPLSMFYDVVNHCYGKRFENHDILSNYLSGVTKEEFYNVMMFDGNLSDTKKFIVREHFIINFVFVILSYGLSVHSDTPIETVEEALNDYKEITMSSNKFDRLKCYLNMEELIFGVFDYDIATHNLSDGLEKYMDEFFNSSEMFREVEEVAPYTCIKHYEFLLVYDTRKVLKNINNQNVVKSVGTTEHTVDDIKKHGKYATEHIETEEEKNFILNCFENATSDVTTDADAIDFMFINNINHTEIPYVFVKNLNSTKYKIFRLGHENENKKAKEEYLQCFKSGYKTPLTTNYDYTVNIVQYEMVGEKIVARNNIRYREYKQNGITEVKRNITSIQ